MSTILILIISFSKSSTNSNNIEVAGETGLTIEKIYTKNEKFFNKSNEVIFNNVTYYCPSINDKIWNTGLALDSNNLILVNGNQFTYKIEPIQERIYSFYTHLFDSYKEHIKIKDVIKIEENCLLLANAFTAKNSGHELSIIFDAVHFYLNKKNIEKIAVLSLANKYPNNLNLLKKLVNPEKINIIECNKKYQFKKLYVVPFDFHNICKHQYLINNLHNNFYKFSFNSVPKKIILLKCTRNQNTLVNHTVLKCENLIKKLEKLDYVFINPETMDTDIFCYTLMNATHIVCSWGGTLYTNMIFFNKNASVIILRPYSHGNNIKFWKYAYELANQLIIIKKTHMDMDTLENENYVDNLVQILTKKPFQISSNTNMLLQEYYFRQALYEKNIPIAKDFKIHHESGKSTNNGITYPFCFPERMIKELLKEEIKDSSKKYFYQGVFTENKKWIKEYIGKKGAYIKESSRGRDTSKKYSIDLEYYKNMKQHLFVLTPTDVYPWSYRFFEAILCRAIPILNDSENDIWSKHFHFYKKSEEHIYRVDWVNDNINKFLGYHKINI